MGLILILSSTPSPDKSMTCMQARRRAKNLTRIWRRTISQTAVPAAVGLATEDDNDRPIISAHTTDRPVVEVDISSSEPVRSRCLRGALAARSGQNHRQVWKHETSGGLDCDDEEDNRRKRHEDGDGYVAHGFSPT